MSYAQEIEKVAGGADKIIGVVIGKDEWSRLGDREIPDEQANKLLTWEVARPLLDYSYDAGYGGEDCHAVHVWTEDMVIFAPCYDGSTWLSALPRNPQHSHPIFHGGG